MTGEEIVDVQMGSEGVLGGIKGQKGMEVMKQKPKTDSVENGDT